MKNEIVPLSITEQAFAKIEFTDAKAFEAIVAAISGLADKYRGLKITDTKSYKVVVSGIAEMRGLRIAVENRRKEKKADILAAGRQIDGGAKKIAELLWPIESELKKTKDAEDVRKEAIKAEKEQAEKERIESIQSRVAAFPPDMSRLPQLLKMSAPEIREMQNVLTAVEIDVEIYQEFTPDAIKAKTDKTKLLQEHYIARITADAETAKQKAEADRVEQVRKDQEAKEEAFKKEQDRIEAERLAKIEAQRIVDEKIREEQETALRKQEEKQRTKQKIEDDRLAKIREQQETEAQKLRDDQTEIDAQKKAIQDEKDRIEQEKAEQIRLDQEKKAQAERDRLAEIEAETQEKARVEKEAQEKTAREKADAEEKKKQAELRPDKKALELYWFAVQKSFIAIERPLLKTPPGNMILTKIQTNTEKFFNDILDIIDDM